MCFSESASFASSAMLAVMSYFSLKTASKQPRYFALALIPLFFAIQQFSEGLEWHSINAGIPEMAAAKYVFLFFAYAWWPFWIPLSLLIAEEKPSRYIYLSALTVLGFLLTTYNLYHLYYFPVQTTVINKSIHYTTGIPYEEIWPYLFLTLTPWFVSSLKGTKVLGIVIAISTALSSYFYYESFTSVWCFFSALISGVVIIILKLQKRLTN